MRQRLAPSAARTAISRCRATARQGLEVGELLAEEALADSSHRADPYRRTLGPAVQGKRLCERNAKRFT